MQLCLSLSILRFRLRARRTSEPSRISEAQQQTLNAVFATCSIVLGKNSAPCPVPTNTIQDVSNPGQRSLGSRIVPHAAHLGHPQQPNSGSNSGIRSIQDPSSQLHQMRHCLHTKLSDRHSNAITSRSPTPLHMPIGLDLILLMHASDHSDAPHLYTAQAACNFTFDDLENFTAGSRLTDSTQWRRNHCSSHTFSCLAGEALHPGKKS